MANKKMQLAMVSFMSSEGGNLKLNNYQYWIEKPFTSGVASRLADKVKADRGAEGATIISIIWLDEEMKEKEEE